MNTETFVTDLRNSSARFIDEARERLKTGRNEPCPCGSGRKYKKCCRPADEELSQRAKAESWAQSQSPIQSVAESLSGPILPEDAADPGAGGTEPLPETREISETERQSDELWDWLDSLNQPSAAQMDEWVQNLLSLPPEATQWCEVMDTCAQKGHPDLPAIFRQISACVPHTRETGMSFFYWNALKTFMREGLSAMLPEVLAGFMKLDEHSYDADALAHIEDILLADRFESEALALAEHFLPFIRGDGRLMSYATPNTCHLIFELRAGMTLRGGPETVISPQAVSEALRRNLEEDIHEEAINSAARVACETDEPEWTRAHFDLVTGDISESKQAWRDCLNLYDALMRVAREAWRIDGVPPGCSYVGLSRLLASVYDERSRNMTKRKSNKTGRKESRANLLNYLNPTGLEQHIVRTCQDLIGINAPRARIFVDAYTVLVDFADRHRLIADGVAAAMRTELVRLRGVLRRH